MRLNIILKLALLPLLLCFSLLAHADKSYSNIFIFGDSLSDTGNLGSTGFSIPPPYFNKRFSNGTLAVETFAAKFGKTAGASLHLIGQNAGNNFSVAGATASPDIYNQNDLSTQIFAFQASHGYIAPHDALYIIFLGGNDIRLALRQADRAIAESILQSGIEKVHAAIESLKQMGAHSFFVINAPNIALIPETSIVASATGNLEYMSQAEDLTRFYNKKLHRLVEKIEEQYEIDIIEFDLFKLFNKVVNKSTKFGFTNNSNACFSTISLAFHIDCKNGSNADQFVFFDEIHPTARVHTIFGDAFYKKLTDENDEHDDETEEDNS